MWTKFWDMSSGGGQKLGWNIILIEMPAAEAKAKFEALFNRDPDNVSCECCGPDYSIDTSETLGKAAAFHHQGRTLMEYLASGEVNVISEEDAK